MTRSQNKIRVLALALCVLFSVFVGAVVARADGDNTLTVVASQNEEFRDDLATANVVMDIYKLADADLASGGFDCTVTSEFAAADATLGDLLDAALKGTGEYQDVADAAAAAVKSAGLKPLASPTAAEAAEGVSIKDNGMYLILAHGADVTDGKLVANSANWEYTFPASLVAVPGNAAGDTTGEWLTEVEAQLKPARRSLFGSLIINKTVEDFTGKPVKFVFHIVGEGYDEYASISYPTYTYTKVTHIPAGIEVTVTEEYSGARYQYVSGGGTVTIAPDAAVEAGEAETASVSFVNAPNGNHPDGGNGIENHFEYDPDKQDWPLTPDPAPAE